MPNDLDAYNSLGAVLYKLGQYEEATKYYQKAIENDPNFSVSYFNLGLLKYELKQYEEAIKYYQKAIENDAYEAIMVMEDGTISEGASSNLWMVDGNNQVVTRNASNVILNGITKLALTELADIHRYKVVEKPFTVDEAINAKELFITSATAIVTPIIQLNNHVIADGKVGPISAALRSAYLERAFW